MATETKVSHFSKPVPGGDDDAWAGLLNANFDLLDALLSAPRTAGTGAAYTLALDAVPSVLTAGLVVYFVAHAASSANATLKVGALPAAPLKYYISTGVKSLAANDLRAGQFYGAVYDSTAAAWLVLGLRAGDDVYLRRTGDTLAGQLTTSNTTIPNTLAALLTLARFQARTASNQEYLELIAYRNAAGSDWKGVEQVLRRMVDSTETGSLRFLGTGVTMLTGQSGVELAANSTVAGTLGVSGALTAGPGGSFANGFGSGGNSLWFWQKLPGGLILQGGSSVLTTDANGNAAVAFPMAFPGGAITALVSNGDTSPGSETTFALVSLASTYLLAHWVHGGAGTLVRLNWLVAGT